MSKPPVNRFQDLISTKKPKAVVSIVLAVIAILYLATFAVLAKQLYAATMPTKPVRVAAQFFPIPAARVDSGFVWMGDYLERYDYIDSFVRKTHLEDFTPEQTRDQVVDYLVETRLIGQLARQQRVRVNREEIESAYAKLGEQPGVGGTAEIERVLRELYNMDAKSFKGLIGEQLIRERVEQQVFLHVKARHILVSSENEANRIAEEIKNGKEFAELAKQHSQDATSRDTGGSLGSIGRGSSLPDPVEEVIFSLAPEALPAVVKSDLGHHVIDTEERLGVLDENFADWLNRQKHERSIKVFLPTSIDWADD